MAIGHEPYSPTPDDPEFASWKPENNPSNPKFFPSMMKYMDKKIGEILSKLRSAGIAKNTLVIYAGDNGTSQNIYFDANGITHIQGEKGKSIEGGTHVPLIAYWPGHIVQGSSNNDLIDFTDFFPTFADASQTTNLKQYGILDGKSFYTRIVGNTGNGKTQLFFHYCPNPGLDGLMRWARDKTYKYYHSGRFFNIVNDPKELSPLADQDLTQSELNIKTNLKHFLDSMPNWFAPPVINSQFVTNITGKSAKIGATIVNSGKSVLIERGSTLAIGDDKPELKQNRQRDNTIGLGEFTDERSGLNYQTKYTTALYAMNANLSNSTAYAVSVFFTLSNPPLSQPTTFTATDTCCTVNLHWNNAKFPSIGAKKAGYLLVYSLTNIVLRKDANGHAPDSVVINGEIVSVTSTVLPTLPPVFAKVSGLVDDTTYNFMLVPYTWNGSSNSTYNYLKKGALKTSIKLIAAGKTFAAKEAKFIVFPNPAKSEFHIILPDELLNEQTLIDIYNTSNKKVFSTSGVHNKEYIVGKSFMPGVYFVHVKTKETKSVLTILKE
jgi:hypothetical protein